MPVPRKRSLRSDKSRQINGLYVHSSPPRVLQLNSAHIKQLIRSGDVERLEAIVYDGQGKKLLGEYSPDYKVRTFLKNVPALMAKISLLHDAVNSGRLEELQSLLDEENEKTRKKLILAKDDAGVGLLHKAVYYDLKEIAEWIVRNYPVTATSKDADGRTAYHYTPMCQNVDVLQKLLKAAGADPAALDNRQRSAKYYRDHISELELPSPHKSHVTSRRNTAIKESLNIKKSNIRIWIHQRDLNSLQQVLWEGHGAKLLQEHSNNPKVKRFLEACPHILGAIRDVHSDVINDDLESLKEHTNPPAPNVLFIAKDSNGLTPLHKAAGLGRQEIAEYIIAHNPKSLSCVDNEGRTPLHYSVLLKDGGKMFDYLVEAGADEGAIDNKSKSAAFYKTRNNEIDAKVLQVIPDSPRKANSQFDWSILGVAATPAEEMVKTITEAEEENGAPEVEAEAETEQNGAAEENNNVENGDAETETEVEANGDSAEDTSEPPEPETEEEPAAEEEGGKDEDEGEEETEPAAEAEPHEDEAEEATRADTPMPLQEEAAPPEDPPVIEEPETAAEEEEAEPATEADDPPAPEEAEAEAEPEPEPEAEPEAENEVEPETEAETAEAEPGEEEEKDKEEEDDEDKKSETSEKDKEDVAIIEPEGVIEGIVNGENEIESVNEQGPDASEYKDDEIAAMVESGNMEQLAALVLNGDGDRLLGHTSDSPELQAFLDNVPVYMSKINRIHLASRDGSLKELQAALDRRKFAIAKDKISPNGASPLHVATIFGNTSIVRYLAGRFPETVSMADDNGRTPLHYAAVVPDNGHYYNLLVHLGANTRAEDKFGSTPEFYRLNQGEFSHRILLQEYGAEEMAEEMLSDKDLSNAQVEMPFFFTEEGRYLASSLGDPLIKGLTEVANKRPTDPIAFLAQYLYNFANNNNNRARSRGRTQESQAMITSGSPEPLEENENVDVPTNIEVVTVDPNETGDEDDSAFNPTSRATKHPPPVDVKVAIGARSFIITVYPDENYSSDAILSYSQVSDEHGQSMLHFAAARSHGRNALYQLLMESEINIGYRDELYRTARDISIQASIPENTVEIDRYVLQIATKGDTDKLVELLLDGYDHIIDIIDEDGVPIVDAVGNADQPDTVAFLHSILAFEERRERVHHAIREGNLNDVKDMLADENDTGSGKLLAMGKNSYGRCTLHIAVLCQQEEIVDFLANAFPETLRIGDNLERTALHYAMGIEKIESVSRVLIKAGATRVAKDLKGRQPTYYFMNKSDILRLQEEEETF